MRERRVADFWVSENDLVDLLGNSRGWFKVELPELPAGARLLAVHHDWQSRSFLLRFEHDSFRVTQPGSPVEIVGRLVVEWKAEEPINTPTIVESK